MGFWDSLGKPINGFTFTGVTINGRLAIISDQMPVKNMHGQEVHVFEMPPDFDPLTGEQQDTLICSQKFFDDTMSMVTDKDKVDAISTH